MTSTRNRRVLTYVGIILSLVFLWLALRRTNLSEVIQMMRQSNLWLVIPFLIAYTAYFWLRSMRWRLMLSPICDVSTQRLFRLVVIGYAGSTLLPMRMGELVRVYMAQRVLDVSYGAIFTSIAIEHIFDFLIILCVISATLLMSSEQLVLETAGWILAAVTIAVSAAMFAYAKWTTGFLDILDRSTTFLPGEWRTKLIRQFAEGAVGLKALGRPRVLATLTILSLLQWICMFACIYISLAALEISASLSAVLTVLALTVVAIIIPTGPGDVGAVQLAYVLALEPFGTSSAEAFAASVYFHMISSVSVVIAGLYYLNSFGYSFRRVRDEAKSLEKE